MLSHWTRRFALVLFCLTPLAVQGADWPTWRHDPSRTAASPADLPQELHLQWVREFSPVSPAWAEDPRIQFDAHYEPIVQGRTLFVGSSHDDSITALSTRTGERLWKFYANGPIRFAPVADGDRLYFGSDDGCVYCVATKDGSLLWKFDARPSPRKILGNARLISVWPVRGGPVLHEGSLYFTMGVWPFEGAFLHCLDAKTGKRRPITAPIPGSTTLKDLSPQGYLAIGGSRLYLPCGRARVECRDVVTGKRVSLKYDSRGKTDYHAIGIGPWLFHGDAIYNAEKAKLAVTKSLRPVLTESTIYSCERNDILATDISNPTLKKTRDRNRKQIELMVLNAKWRLALDKLVDIPRENLKKWVAANPLVVDLKAGSRIYGHRADTIFSVDVPNKNQSARLAWKRQIEGTPATMIAADDRLFVVTKEGKLLCYGGQKVVSKTHALQQPEFSEPAKSLADQASAILDQSKVADGYCLAFGLDSGRLLEELARRTKLIIIGIDNDQKTIDTVRARLDSRGLLGSRILLMKADPLRASLPPYLASLVVSESLPTGSRADLESRIFHVLRPYGGVACLPFDESQHKPFAERVEAGQFPGAKLTRAGGTSYLHRPGALPGSGDWTHEYGDASNTLMSQDKLVKAPLGLLWFGGPASSGELFYDRHDWGPSMAVIGGRMFIQGPEKLTAVDVYTGRIFWKIALPKRVALGRRGNFTYTGFHFVALEDSIYLNDAETCLRIDPATGRKLGEFTPPKNSAGWGRMRIWRDYLIMTVFRKGLEKEPLPREMVVMNRLTGEELWSKKADHSFPFFAVGKDKMFCFDGKLTSLYRDMKRKGLVPKAEPKKQLLGIDMKTGKTVWKTPTSQVVTWLSFSPKHKMVLSSNKTGLVARRADTGSVVWEKSAVGKGFKGHPESVWDKVILMNDWVIDQRGPGKAYDIETGKPILREHPVSGKLIPWEFTKSGHHCNYAIANEHLLTFRAASAGFCDLESTNTSRLLGFRSGCRNSLIPANGVLNAPNFAHGCICSYSLFTSLAFVHLPEADMWAYSALKSADEPVKRIGVNLGAPGDRLADNGTLWIDYPSKGGTSPDIPVKVVSQGTRWFRLLGSQVESASAPWVASSGVEGVKSVALTLAKKATKPRSYTVRLYFLEPDKVAPGERVFDVYMQGKQVLIRVDVAQEAKGSRRGIIKTIPGVTADRQLLVEFEALKGKAILSGIELIEE